MFDLKHAAYLFTVMVLLLTFVLPGSAAEKPDKKGILLVAFGTAMPKATEAIDALVNATKTAFPDTEVRVAYTSNIIRRILKKERSIDIPSPAGALAKMNDDGFTRVCVQPMHVIPGEEYDDLKGVVDAFASLHGKFGFDRLVLGRPFLADAKDCETMAGILRRRFEKKAGTAVVLMGHGTAHMANAMYSELQLALSRMSDRFFVGTVEATPSFEDVLAVLKKTPYRTVLLSPFMIVAGDHANNDLAGAAPDSWLSRFKKAGFKVETALTGIGDYPEVERLFVQRVRELMGDLN